MVYRISPFFQRGNIGNSYTLTAAFSTDASNGKSLRWGICGAGAISNDFAKAVQFTPGAEVRNQREQRLLKSEVVKF
jgi:hypothetical protein